MALPHTLATQMCITQRTSNHPAGYSAGNCASTSRMPLVKQNLFKLLSILRNWGQKTERCSWTGAQSIDKGAGWQDPWEDRGQHCTQVSRKGTVIQIKPFTQINKAAQAEAKWEGKGSENGKLTQRFALPCASSLRASCGPLSSC